MRGAVLALALAGCAYDRPELIGAGDGGTIDAPAPLDGDGRVDAMTGCTDDLACASGACVAGACAPETDVRYVAVGGSDNLRCSQRDPCGSVGAAQAVSPPGRAVIVIAGGTYLETVQVLRGDVTLIGAGPVAPRIVSPAGPAITVQEATATLRNLSVLSSGTADGDGVRCDRSTVTVEHLVARGSHGNGITSHLCTLAVTGSQLTSNGSFGVVVDGTSIAITASTISGNGQGGVMIEATDCTLVGSLVDDNGSAESLLGGGYVACTGSLRVENLTFAGNNNRSDRARSLFCDGQPPVAVARNLLLADDRPQLEGCDPRYSLFVGPQAPPAGEGNRAIISAGFVADGSDYHLAPFSVARGAGDPDTAPALDFEGQLRPIGAWDVGGDEVP